MWTCYWPWLFLHRKWLIVQNNEEIRQSFLSFFCMTFSFFTTYKFFFVQQVPAEYYEAVTVYFSDIVGFTEIAAENTPLEVRLILFSRKWPIDPETSCQITRKFHHNIAPMMKSRAYRANFHAKRTQDNFESHTVALNIKSFIRRFCLVIIIIIYLLIVIPSYLVSIIAWIFVWIILIFNSIWNFYIYFLYTQFNFPFYAKYTAKRNEWFIFENNDITHVTTIVCFSVSLF